MRYRVIQYLIGKLSDMIKMGQESLVVATLLASVSASWKVTIYYINEALLKLNRYALYISEKIKFHKSVSLCAALLACFRVSIYIEWTTRYQIKLLIGITMWWVEQWPCRLLPQFQPIGKVCPNWPKVKNINHNTLN